MNNVDFSIITINYNNSSGLEKTIRSVEKQKYFKFEHVIVDGLSTDNSIKIIIENKHDKLRFISERDSGISDAFNKGISLAKGDYIIMLNSGDILFDSQVLSKIHDILSVKNNKPDVIWGKVVSDLGFFVGKYKEKKLTADSIPHQGAFVSRKTYLDVAKYDVNYKIRMDYKFFSELLKKKLSFDFIDEVISIYETGGVSMRNKTKFYLEGVLVDFKYLNSNIFGNIIRYIYHSIKNLLKAG